MQIRASLWMLAAVASLILVALASRELSSDLSVLQILFLRNSIGLPVLVAGVLLVYGPSGIQKIRTGSLKLQFLRNGIQMTAQAGWIYSLAVLPLATVFAIEYTQPLWAILLGSLLLAEHPHRWQKWGVAIGLVGVMIIVRPGPDGFSLGALVMLGASVFYGGVYLTTRMLGRTDAALAIPFWTCVIQSPITLSLALLDWRVIESQHWFWILSLGLGSLAQQFCLAAALRLAPLARVIPIDYLRLPVIAVIGVMFYAEGVDPIEMAGALVVIGGVLLTQKQPGK
jgi:drug/metabolite transporter (DMT)-like permease